MSDPVTPTLSARALCSPEDVKRLVPGYVYDEETEDVVTDICNGISDDIYEETGREFVALDPTEEDPTERLFDLRVWNGRERRVRVGDMRDVPTLVTVQLLNGDVLETVDAGNYVALARLRQSWEPIRQLWFPPCDVDTPSSELRAGRVLAVTAMWGFPSIPDRLRVSAAKLALYRYMTDFSSNANTALAEAASELNLAGMFKDATRIVGRFGPGGFA